MSTPKHSITIYLSVEDYEKAIGIMESSSMKDKDIKTMSKLVSYFLSQVN